MYVLSIPKASIMNSIPLDMGTLGSYDLSLFKEKRNIAYLRVSKI